MKPRILLLSTAYLPLIGGSELAIRHLTDRLPGYDFDMVTARFERDAPLMETIGRVRVFRAGGRWARVPFLVPKALLPLAIAVTAFRLMTHNSYALIHSYQASQAAGAAWLIHLVRPHTKFVLTLQEGKELHSQSWLVRRLRGFIIRSADVVTGISRHLIEYARSRGAKRTVLVPNGVDTSVFTPAARDPGGNTIVTVSRLVPKNGLEALIHAMPAVIAAVPGAQLIIVGEGPLRSRLETLNSRLATHDSVRFVGTVPHELLPGVLQRARVFVRPSLSEGFGTAFLEAMACGLPVVASARGGITDFISDERTGLFCNPEDPSDIASKLVRALTDGTLRMRLRDNGLKLASDYDWSVMASRMNSVYQDVISGFPTRSVE